MAEGYRKQSKHGARAMSFKPTLQSVEILEKFAELYADDEEKTRSWIINQAIADAANMFELVFRDTIEGMLGHKSLFEAMKEAKLRGGRYICDTTIGGKLPEY